MASVFTVLDIGTLPTDYEVDLTEDSSITALVAGDFSLTFKPGPGRVILRLTNIADAPVNWRLVGFHKLFGTYDSRPNAINYVFIEGFGAAAPSVRIYQPEVGQTPVKPTITYRLDGNYLATFELSPGAYKAMLRSITDGLSISADFGHDGYSPPPGYEPWPVGTGFLDDPSQATLTASNNGLLVTSSSDAHQQIRTNTSVSNGHYAYKAVINSMQNIGNVCGFGILGASVPIDDLGDTNVHLYQGTSIYVAYKNQSVVAIAAPFSIGSEIEVLLDLP